MSRKLKWGILGGAEIAKAKVIPALQKGQYSEVSAIASRSLSKSRQIAGEHNISKTYNSYEELLADKTIDVVYIPLPNHLHAEWSIKSMEAGKHVLCEKPISLTIDDIEKTMKVRDLTGMKICEGFMVRSHPQWLKAREIIQNGTIGTLKAIHGFFSYFDRDPKSIINIQEFGGGGLWDIGCYPINTSRFLFGEEPMRVISLIENDPDFNIDRLTSAILEFPSGQAVFTCATQLSCYQRIHAFGTAKHLEVEIPFNSPDDMPTRLFLTEKYSRDSERSIVEIEVCDQYAYEVDRFSLSIINNTEVPVPLEDSLKNTSVIKALLKSAKSSKWEYV